MKLFLLLGRWSSEGKAVGEMLLPGVVPTSGASLSAWSQSCAGKMLQVMERGSFGLQQPFLSSRCCLSPLQCHALKIWAKAGGLVPGLRAVPCCQRANGAVVPGELIKHHLRGPQEGCKPHHLLGVLLVGGVPRPPSPPIPMLPGQLSPPARPWPASLLCSCLFLSAGRITSSRTSLSWPTASW